eukprot:tig00021036_g17392.t1
MAKDVLTVLLVLVVVFGSFCIGLWAWSLNVHAASNADGTEGPSSLREMAGTLYFAVLGESDSNDFAARVPFIGSTLLSIYQILTVVLLLNVLTGLFSSTITATFEKAQTVYAYGRTKMLLRYHRREQQVAAPFNLLWLLRFFFPRLATFAVNIASGIVLLPPLLLLAALADLGRLFARAFSGPAADARQGYEHGIRKAWAESIEKHRRKPAGKATEAHGKMAADKSKQHGVAVEANSVGAAASAPEANGAAESASEGRKEPQLSPMRYDESREEPDPTHTGPLELNDEAPPRAHVERLDAKLTAKLEKVEAKLEAKLEAQQAETKAQQAKLEAKLDAILAAVKPDAGTAGGAGGLFGLFGRST